MTQDPLETDRSDPIRVERKENIGCRGSAVAERWDTPRGVDKGGEKENREDSV